MRLRFTAGFGMALLASAATAQVPPTIAAQIRAGGQAMDPAASGALYATLFAGQTYEDIKLTRDIPYGADPLQVLDIYEPVSAEAPLTVMLFVHGGGFTRGDKHGPFYPDNMTAWAARGGGMVGVNINYRLAPGTTFPGAVDDLGAAIAWVRGNISSHGGDPARIVLVGHSAGANHVMDYLGHKGAGADGVKGAVLISPNYAAEMPEQPNVYYGSDAETQLIGPVSERLRAAGIPLFVAYAEFDPEAMRRTAEDLLGALCSAPATCPKSIELKDHNHYTEGMAVGTDDVSLSQPVLEWIEGLK